MTTFLKSATASSGFITDPTVGDGTLAIQTGNTPGSQVTALSFAADGTPTFLKARGGVAQIQTATLTTVATGTTVFTGTDTIPTNTAGDQYLSLAVTPTNANSLLEIEVQIPLSCSVAGQVGAALLQDATANALAASLATWSTDVPTTLCFKHIMTAGTTSATTFKVRAGGSAGTTTVNGRSSARLLGGAMYARITIKEYLP